MNLLIKQILLILVAMCHCMKIFAENIENAESSAFCDSLCYEFTVEILPFSKKIYDQRNKERADLKSFLEDKLRAFFKKKEISTATEYNMLLLELNDFKDGNWESIFPKNILDIELQSKLKRVSENLQKIENERMLNLSSILTKYIDKINYQIEIYMEKKDEPSLTLLKALKKEKLLNLEKNFTKFPPEKMPYLVEFSMEKVVVDDLEDLANNEINKVNNEKKNIEVESSLDNVKTEVIEKPKRKYLEFSKPIVMKLGNSGVPLIFLPCPKGEINGQELQSFLLGRYEITQHQFEVTMGKKANLSKNKHPNNPVENIKIEIIEKFIERLNNNLQKNLPLGYKFDLPSLNEWNYAHIANTKSPFHWGVNKSDVIEYENLVNDRNGVQRIINVGKYLPNVWGFYDLGGNVLEVVYDEKNRLIKYAGWNKNLTSTIREEPENFSFGFRVAIIPDPDFKENQNAKN